MPGFPAPLGAIVFSVDVARLIGLFFPRSCQFVKCYTTAETYAADFVAIPFRVD